LKKVYKKPLKDNYKSLGLIYKSKAMHSILRFSIFSMCLMFLNMLSVKAQWEQITSFQGGNPTVSITESANKLIGIGQKGLYLADKTTRIWQEVPLFNQITMYSVAAKNDTLFVVHQGFDIFARLYVSASYDEGNTWETPWFLANGWGASPKVAFVNQQIIVAGYMDNLDCLRKSLDYGQTWITEVYPPGFEVIPKVLDVNETHILYHVANSIDTSDVYSYDVASGSWHAIPNTSETYNEPGAQIFNNRIYAKAETSSSFTIYSTALDGSDVQMLYSDTNVYGNYGFFESNGQMVLIFDDPLTPFGAVDFYISTDTAQTFTYQNTFTIPYTMDIFLGIWPLESGELIVGGERLHILPSDYQSYEEITDGFIVKNVVCVTSVNNTLYASANVTAFGKSEDNGLSFEDISAENKYPMGGILHQGDTIFYESGDNQTYYRFYRSYDNGVTYESFPFGGPDLSYSLSNQKSAFLNNKIYTIFGESIDIPVLLMSDDFGETWSTIQCPTVWPGILHVANGSLYLYAEDLYRFNEQNNTWTNLNSPLENSLITSNYDRKLRTIGNNLWMVNNENESVTLLSDGVTWINTGITLFDVAQVGNIVYGLSDTMMYASADYGQTWQSTGVPVPPGMNTKMVNHLSELFVYGGYNTSIWKIAAPQFVSGLVYYDNNGNGNYDNGEPGVPEILIHSENSETYAMSGPTGSFILSYAGEEDQITVEVNNVNYMADPSSITVNGIEEIFIGIKIIGTVSDLTTDAVLNAPFRPGFSTSVSLLVRNLGNVEQGGELTFTLPENVSFTTASVAPTSQTANVLSWTIGELATFEMQHIQVELLTNVSAVLGDTATFVVNINSTVTDDNLANDSVTNESIIVGSYDPNDKACSRGELLTPTQLSISNEFEYLIRFQNTGTYYAENVVIKDTISDYFDLATLRIIGASDTMHVTFDDGQLVNFNFPNIFLLDSTTNEPLSHGFVKYAIRLKPGLELGSVIQNTAYIYFDFNAPIITNTAETVFDLPSGLDLNDTDMHVLVYPNPTNATLKLIEYANQTVSVTLTDLSGKVVARQMCVNGELDLSSLRSAVYLGVIKGENGQQTRRFKVVKI
jgi:hypothetical protein